MSVRYFCEMGSLSPALGMWIPDILLLVISVYLIYHVANDKTFKFPPLIFPKRTPLKEDTPIPLAPAQRIERSDTIEYMGSSTTDKFHRSDCRWVKRISQENIIVFQSKQDALDKGHVPCNTCKP